MSDGLRRQMCILVLATCLVTPVFSSAVAARDVTFRVHIPENTPLGEPVYLLIMPFYDWAWQRHVEMTSTGPGVFETTVALTDGAILRYTYDRWDETSWGEWKDTRESTGWLDINSRLAVISGESQVVEDVVAAWSDVAGVPETGSLRGRVIDATTAAPLPDTNVTAGGIHISTDYDGRFELSQLAVGRQRVTALRTLGDHHAADTEVDIVGGETTEVELTLAPATPTQFTFSVELPAETPADAEIRVMGSVYQVGARIEGSSLNAPAMPGMDCPVMSRVGNRATLTLALFDGMHIQYEYTLGEPLSGAEHTAGGQIVYRDLVVSASNPSISDRVGRWGGDWTTRLSLYLTVPEWTPHGVPVAIDVGPTYWLTPVAEGKWVFHIYGYPGQEVHYRYRLGGGANGDELGSPMRSAQVGAVDTEVNDVIASWAYIPDGWTGGLSQLQASDSDRLARAVELGFAAGYCLDDYWSGSFSTLLPTTFARIRAFNGTWVEVSSVWSYGKTSPLPEVEPRPLRTPSVLTPREVLIEQIELAHEYGLHVLLAPQFNMEMSSGGAAVCGAHDSAWWEAWVREAREMWMWNAQVAAEAGAEALLLPGHCFHNFPSRAALGSPAEALAFDLEIQALVAEIRGVYTGRLLMGYGGTEHAFPGAADWVGITTFQTGHPSLSSTATADEWASAYDALFATRLDPLYARYGKPIVLYQVHVPSVVTPGDPAGEAAQARQVQGLMQAALQRPWLAGTFAFGYHLVDAPLLPDVGVRARISEEALGVLYETETGAAFRVTSSGDVAADGRYFGQSFLAGSADVAEWVPAAGAVAAGEVLELDTGHPGSYRPSTASCSALVAGVASSLPGFVLGVTEQGAGRALLAVSGIVPVKVTNEGGPIQPGDLLVSSSTTGYAMRWAGEAPCPCALVGKALEPMTDERGMISVLLTAH